MDALRKSLFRPFQDLGLGGPRVRDHRSGLEIRRQVGHRLMHGCDGHREHDHVCFTRGLCQVPSALVNRAHLFGSALVVEVGVEPHHFERLAVLDLVLL